MGRSRPLSFSVVRRRALFEARAKELQRCSLQTLRSHFPPWYVRTENLAQRIFVRGGVSMSLIVVLLSVAGYVYGWPDWLLGACWLISCVLFCAVGGFLVVTTVCAWIWGRRHPGHLYLCAHVRYDALSQRRDLYPFRRQALQELRGRLTGTQLDELEALLPPTLAARRSSHAYWSERERCFWQRYEALMSAA